MLDTITVTAQLYEQGGEPAVGARITYVLSTVEIDAGVVIPLRQTAVADANGVATCTLWPNSAGERCSHYVVQAVSAEDGATLLQGYAVFPDSPNVTLQDFLQPSPLPVQAVARRNLVLMTGYDYHAAFQVLQPDCTPADLAFYTPRLRVYTASAGALVFDSATDPGAALAAAGDEIAMSLLASSFASWPSGYYYTLDLTLAGDTYPVAYGAMWRQP